MPNSPATAHSASGYRITIQVVNPTTRAITFSTPSNQVTANVPGGDVVYAGNTSVTQGSVTSQPAIGGSGNVVWNPGSVAGGATATFTYDLTITASAPVRILTTGSGATGTTARYLDETTDRVPFTDFYDAETGRRMWAFQARPVVGALYAPILVAKRAP